MSTPFVHTRRVEFGDTDMAGIMHFSNFFRFMESAETDFLRSKGLKVSWAEFGLKHGFPRVSVSCDYREPARFEDLLTVEVTVERIGTKSMTLNFVFTRDDLALAVGHITSVYVRDNGKGGMEALEIPDDLRDKLEA